MAPPRDLRPVPSESLPMPPSDRIGVNDNQAARPCGPRGPQHDPECAVGVIELWPRLLFLERHDLLSQGQIFNHEQRRRQMARIARAPSDTMKMRTRSIVAECGPPSL